MTANQLKLSQLRAFVAVADCGNFSEAALKLDVSQSSISHAIAALEEELGVTLLHRGRHGANLTPTGDQILVRAKRILNELQDIGAIANHARGLEGGLVRVATFRSMATNIIPVVIAYLQREAPGIEIAIVEYHHMSEVERSLRQGQADIAVAVPPETEGFDTWEILQDDYIAVVPSSSDVAGNQMTWKQLSKYPLIVSSCRDCSRWIHTYIEQSEFPLHIAQEIRSDSIILGMAAQHLGVGILPRMATEPLPPGLKVCNLPAPLHRSITVSLLTDGLHTPATYAFLKAMHWYQDCNTSAVS
jgi:DNA-binding transcriptional LysR family regulator